MTHTCPRRAEIPFHGGTDLDTYEPRRGLVGQPRGCFYRRISLPHTADGCARQCPAHRGEASS